MPLAPRDSYAEAIGGLIDRRASRLALSSNGVATTQDCQAVGPGEDVANEQDLDFAQHYGFVSRPVADTELVTVPGNPVDVSVAEMCDLPSGDLASIASGETALYDSSGNFVYCRASNGVWVKALAGGVVIQSSAGGQILIHRGGGTVAAAYQGGRVGARAGMTIWINAVSAALGIAAPADFGEISDGSSAVEIEV